MTAVAGPVAAAGVAGALSHALFFRRVDVDTRPFALLGVFGGAHVALAWALCRGSGSSTRPAHAAALLLEAAFLAALCASLLTYRAFLHPLRHFPGPFGARLSKFWAVRQTLRSGLRWYRVDAALHGRYGDYVRTGPRELSITDPGALGPILGFASKTLKAPFYDSLEDSVSTTTNKDLHRRRRRLWDTSMKQLLATYHPQLDKFTDLLLDRLARTAGEPVVVNDLATYYSYDVMTQLAFSEPRGFLDGSAPASERQMLADLQQGIDAIGLLQHVPWVLGILMKLATTFPTPMSAFNGWAAKALAKRMKMQTPAPDLMSHLIASTSPTDAAGQHLLFTDSRVIITAGADTTSTALATIFLKLLFHPRWIPLVRAECSPLLSASPSAFSPAVSYPVLDAVIAETLRLHPPVLFGSPRVTPPQGLKIPGTDVFVPGGTVVYVPGWQVQRDGRNFAEPERFVPERWMGGSKGEMVGNRGAWLVFLMGENNCPGKSLAMMEIRSVVARTLHEFDISLPPGEDLVEDAFFAQIKDRFVAGVPKQKVVFTRRQK